MSFLPAACSNRMNGSVPTDQPASITRSLDYPISLPLSGRLEKLLRFFFKPVEFHFELADLAVELRDKFLMVSFFFLSPVCKKIWKAFEKLLSPCPDLVGMNTVFTGQFRQSVFPFCRFKRHLGSKRGIVTLSHVDHCTIPPSRLMAGQNAPYCPVQFLGGSSFLRLFQRGN